MRTVGVVTCSTPAIDPDSPVLLEALASQNVDASLVAWDDASVDWERFDVSVVRSTWDYAPRRDEFLTWARATPRLLNPYDTLVFSSDKHYLRDLASAGVKVVPSTFVDRGDEPVFPEGDFVVKPCVGAGSLDAERYGANDHDAARAHVARLHEQHFDALVQPYVSSVDERGELALIFIDGKFSHAMIKGAMLNTAQESRHVLFRREQMSLSDAPTDALVEAERALAACDGSSLLYARVDLLWTDEGWALLELELVEPSLFLSFAPDAATRLARAIVNRLASFRRR